MMSDETYLHRKRAIAVEKLLIREQRYLGSSHDEEREVSRLEARLNRRRSKLGLSRRSLGKKGGN